MLDPIRVSARYKPKFGQGSKGSGVSLEKFYKRAIDADPNHAAILGNYARFLKTIRGDHDAAETYYKRAVKIDPNQAGILGSNG